MSKKLTIGSLKQESSTFIKTAEFPAVAANNTETFIEIQQRNKHFNVKPEKNTTLLDAALNQHINLDHKCKKGTCGRCRVKVLNGDDVITSVNALEHKKLGSETDTGYRLACQAVFI
ncbi:2Fe-2S iron-sulfur cluster-binding protein [Alteribacillus sp. JSM 102045]|uniref:2Fe-2S iron-sulfur cluster-binding protein n=1 Tax=Alteribacillus sp. JSM 102045 TaxID=1562101 RepID=UPI0035C09AFB